MKLKLKCVMQTANEMKAEKLVSTKILGVVALSQRQGLNGKLSCLWNGLQLPESQTTWMPMSEKWKKYFGEK